MIIGAGGVGMVVAQKCTAAPDLFTEVLLASRTLEKCERIRERLPAPIRIARVDADEVSEVVSLIRDFQPALVINVALPYQDLSIMDACLETGVDYLDTANYEPPDVAKYEYSHQWAYHDRFRERGIMALLGCGFDPGMTSIYCTWARKHLFDRINTIDILDCNAGDHGHPFATNFNPEINLREVTARGRYWEEGAWLETDPLSVTMEFDFPEVGPRKAYLMYHEELESLARFLPEVRRIRFWMTFGERYLTCLRVLEDVGMTRIDAVDYEGHPVVPIKLLRKLLPDPATLGERYTGKTSIGCLIEGTKAGQARRVFIYNVSDHAACYREVGAQAVSYTAGVPAACGAALMLSGRWRGCGVLNVEELDPDPFMEAIGPLGLPWHVKEC